MQREEQRRGSRRRPAGSDAAPSAPNPQDRLAATGQSRGGPVRASTPASGGTGRLRARAADAAQADIGGGVCREDRNRPSREPRFSTPDAGHSNHAGVQGANAPGRCPSRRLRFPGQPLSNAVGGRQSGPNRVRNPNRDTKAPLSDITRPDGFKTGLSGYERRDMRGRDGRRGLKRGVASRWGWSKMSGRCRG